MNFEIIGGARVSAYTDRDLLEALRQQGFGLPHTTSNEEFMGKVAELLQTHRNVSIDTDSIHSFLFDLQLHGIVKPENAWQMIVADVIKNGLATAVDAAYWHHNLIWSMELPSVVSTNHKGKRVVSTINLDELSKNGYQQSWLRDHLNRLRR